MRHFLYIRALSVLGVFCYGHRFHLVVTHGNTRCRILFAFNGRFPAWLVTVIVPKDMVVVFICATDSLMAL